MTSLQHAIAGNPVGMPILPTDPEELRAFLLSVLDDETLRNLCVDDPEVFFSVCMPETFNRPSADFHRFLVGVATHDQMTAKRAVAVGPRGWGKSSTITEGGPIYIVCRNNNLPVEKRYMFILIVSETAGQAEARLAVIKEQLESNEQIKRFFPEAAGVGRVWRKDMIVTNNDVCIATAGMATSVRGIRYKNRRPDLILCHEKGTPILHNGEWIPVEEHPSFKGVRKCDGFEVRLRGVPSSEVVTPEHRYWARTVSPKSNKNPATIIGEQGWCEARDLTKAHYIGSPIDMTVAAPPAMRVYSPDAPDQTRYGIKQQFIADGFLWSQVAHIAEVKDREFCPITTEDHTYVTAFGLSHNCDDPDSLDTATSPTESAKLEARFTRDVLKCGHKNTDVLVAATIISKMCLAYKLLYGEDYAAWDGRVFKALEHFPTHMKYWDQWGELLKNKSEPSKVAREAAAEAFYQQYKEIMDEGGVSNWPEEYPVKALMREYYVEGRKAFLTEKQNEIIESDIAHFAPERYKYYSPEEFKVAKSYNPLFFAYVDPSCGKAGSMSSFASRGPDLFSVSIIAKVADDQFFLVDTYAAQIKQSLQFEAITQLMHKWPIFKLTVEANAGQMFYINALREYIMDKFRDPDWRKDSATKNLILPRSVTNTVAKEQRISMLEPYMDNWTLQLPLDMPKRHRKLMDELESWPTSTFDDCLDSLSGCFFSAFRTFKLAYLMH